jgi:hypothetical protein
MLMVSAAVELPKYASKQAKKSLFVYISGPVHLDK